MAMVNPMGPMMSGGGGNNFNVKDSRWLTLEVCREFQRSKCSRPETECKFAHPPPHVEVQNGRVTCCFDSIKGKCQRKDPPCKYLHPPQHLREQLLQNGKNNLILKNLQMQVAQAYGIPPMVPGIIPVTWGTNPQPQQQPQTQVRTTPIPTVQSSASVAGSKVNSLSGGLLYAHDLQSGGSQESQLRQMMADEPNGNIQRYTSSPYGGPAGHSYLMAVEPSGKSYSYGSSPSVLPGQSYMMAHPYFNPVQTAAFSPYNMSSPLQGMTGMLPTSEQSQVSLAQSNAQVSANQGVLGQQQNMGNQQKVARADRLEVCRESQRGTCTRQPTECRFAHPPEHVQVDTTDNHVTVCMDFIKGKCSREPCRYYHPPAHLQAQIKATQQRSNVAVAQCQMNSNADLQQDSSHNCVQCISNGMPPLPGMVPYVKRPAMADAKSGLPMYQPGSGSAAAYQQAALAAMQLQQGQAFVPVSFAGHPPSVPRF
ncbi:muscleblind-like protein 2 isoform X2 [Lineus longissimus]|uniref:muscleblind-like protein 2 isoform X2 n=1 Tax=Lineus longissimus TaxID=88925 RepID=UPI00315DF9EC